MPIISENRAIIYPVSIAYDEVILFTSSQRMVELAYITWEIIFIFYRGSSFRMIFLLIHLRYNRWGLVSRHLIYSPPSWRVSNMNYISDLCINDSSIFSGDCSGYFMPVTGSRNVCSNIYCPPIAACGVWSEKQIQLLPDGKSMACCRPFFW